MFITESIVILGIESALLLILQPSVNPPLSLVTLKHSGATSLTPLNPVWPWNLPWPIGCSRNKGKPVRRLDFKSVCTAAV